MASSTPNKIGLLVNGEIKKAIAAATITPGELLEVTGAKKVKPHSTASGVAQPLFLKEQDFIGEGISDSVASGDTVEYIYAQPGDEIYAFFKDGTNQATPASYLGSDGAGNLKVIDTTTPSSVGPALVARSLETQATVAAATRLKVEVL